MIDPAETMPKLTEIRQIRMKHHQYRLELEETRQEQSVQAEKKNCLEWNKTGEKTLLPTGMGLRSVSNTGSSGCKLG
jgi:hypothetical protein